MNETPIVGITMGDGAGIGPEVIVKALASPEFDQMCRPVVIGDVWRLQQAAELCGLPQLTFRTVEHPSEAEFVPGVVDVVDLGLLPRGTAFGVLSVPAGEAAFRYLERATYYAMDGSIDAICTGPTNKEALQAAGHLFPGQTEILAHFTGTEEVSMMLTGKKLVVVHVTTHIGLLDAIEKIDAGLVYRTVRRGHDMLVRAGNPAPKIAVCGINPHAGENGLFGRGEEDAKIVPGLEQARAEGIDAQGPLPADTVFFLAQRGDFDLVVAMYHDQGHGPVKAMGLDAGVNITVGLPVIRTSVDHGTAFDIAGTGVADDKSMIEALRAAVALAPHRSTLNAIDG
jgi:4-hydroxythreonine-4-phosphate dehydrogenase